MAGFHLRLRHLGEGLKEYVELSRGWDSGRRSTHCASRRPWPGTGVRSPGVGRSAVLAIVQAMTSSDHLLDLIQGTPEIDLLLRSSFGFDKSAGGAFFLCAEQNGRRPLVFASSAGEGGLLGDDPADAWPRRCRSVSSLSLTSSSGCTQQARRPDRAMS